MIAALKKSLKRPPTIGMTKYAEGHLRAHERDRHHEGVGRGAHAEADEAGGDHRGVVIAAHDREDDQQRENDHQQYLGGEGDDHRQRQIDELPELEARECHREENREEHVAHRADLSGGEFHDLEVVDHIAHDNGHEHRADVDREVEAEELRQPCGDDAADAHAEQHQQEAVDKVVGVGGEMCIVGVLFRDLLDDLIAQVVLDDELARDRAAEERAEDEAERRRRDGDRRADDGTGRIKVRTNTRRRAGAADHRDRAAGETEERIFAHQRHHTAADGILQNDHHNAQNEEHDNGLAALEQQRNADGKADGREEHDHKDRLQRVVKGDDRRACCVKNGVEDRKAQTADQRGGNAEAAEHGDLLRQHQTEGIHGCAKC